MVPFKVFVKWSPKGIPLGKSGLPKDIFWGKSRTAYGKGSRFWGALFKDILFWVTPPLKRLLFVLQHHSKT